MTEDVGQLPEGYSYGVLCKSDDVGSFTIWFETKDLSEAVLLTSCITNTKNSLIRGPRPLPA